MRANVTGVEAAASPLDEKRRTLEDLFRPPIELMEKGTFEMVIRTVDPLFIEPQTDESCI